MAESTLSLARTQLMNEVGVFLGYGRGAVGGDVAWTSSQTGRINAFVDAGLRNFCYSSGHDWSFMRPVASLTLTIATSTIALPDNFGTPQGQITVTTTSSNSYFSVPITNPEMLRRAFALEPDATGRPNIAAVVPLVGTSATEGQRFQLNVFPTADQEYTLTLAYDVLVDALTSLLPYPYGGLANSETIKEACLASAEQFLDDNMTVHSAKYQELLAKSIAKDQRLKPDNLGYNGDERNIWNPRRLHDQTTQIPFNGVYYP